MPLFEVAILEMPTKKEVEEGSAQEKLVFGPKAIIARDAASAGIAAILEDGNVKVDKAKMQVLVRPFGQSQTRKMKPCLAHI